MYINKDIICYTEKIVNNNKNPNKTPLLGWYTEIPLWVQSYVSFITNKHFKALKKEKNGHSRCDVTYNWRLPLWLLHQEKLNIDEKNIQKYSIKVFWQGKKHIIIGSYLFGLIGKENCVTLRTVKKLHFLKWVSSIWISFDVYDENPLWPGYETPIRLPFSWHNSSHPYLSYYFKSGALYLWRYVWKFGRYVHGNLNYGKTRNMMVIKALNWIEINLF